MFTGLAAARQILSGHAVRIFVIGCISLLGGLAQVSVFVIIVSSALALSQGQASVSLAMGPLGSVDLALPRALALGGGLVVLLVGTAYGTARQSASIAAHVLTTQRRRLMDAFLEASPAAQSTGGGGAFQETATAHTSRSAQVAGSASSVVVAALNLLVLLGGALLVDAMSAVAVILGVVVLSSLMTPLARRRRQAARDQSASSLLYAEALAEVYASSREVRLFGVVGEVQSAVQQRIAAASNPYFRLQLLNRFAPTAFQYAGFGLLIIALAVLAQRSTEALASLASVLLIVLRSFAYAQALQTGLQALSEAVPYWERLQAEVRRLTGAAAPTDRAGREVGAIQTLTVVAGEYTYPDGRMALRGLDLRVERGDSVGIIGPSGSGKSTLVQVLLRLVELQRGALLANGRPASDFHLPSWYRRMSLVPQEAVLVRGSVADNIRFHRPDVSQEAVERAARAAGIYEDIVALPEGFSSQLEHAGRGLSGGQRQRLCLARALAGEPEIIVLDEPTSALDAASAAVVVDTLSRLKGHTTLIVVSHDMSTVAFCDRIVEVVDGVAVDAFAARPGDR